MSWHSRRLREGVGGTPTVKKRAIVVFVVFLTLTAGVWAQTARPTAAGSEIEKQPYLQALTATSVQIRWEGAGTVHGRIDWGAAPDRLDHTVGGSAYPTVVRIPGATEDDPPTKRTVWLQRVELADLTPDTTYYYRVHQGAVTTDVFRFRTPPRRPRAFRFAVYGDTRTFPEDHRKVARAMRKAKPAFIINTGDLVSYGDRWPDWSEQYFAPLHPLFAEVPVWPVRGNHDGSAKSLRPLFHFPGPPGWLYYRFDHGHARFIVLDGGLGRSRPQMMYWLEEQLRAPPRPTWIFIFNHYPSFGSVAKRSYGRGWERERLALLCQRYGVDMVFSGHDHNYMRTVPILAFRAMGGRPTTYVVTAGGGAPLYKTCHATWRAVNVKVHHFCQVDIDGLTLTLNAISADTGETIDSLRLEKDVKGHIVAPADYRRRAREVAEINAIESIRRGLTAFGLRAIDAGDTVPLVRTVDNAFPGPVEVTVRFVGSRRKWAIPPPVQMTLPARSTETPFQMTLTARRAMEDDYDVGHLEVEYRLWDGRTGVLSGEGIHVAKRRLPASH